MFSFLPFECYIFYTYKGVVIRSTEDLDALRNRKTSKWDGYLSNPAELWESLNPESKKIARIRVTEYDNPYQIIHDGSGMTPGWNLSKNCWASIGNDKYVLDFKGITLCIFKSEEDELYHCEKGIFLWDLKKKNRNHNNDDYNGINNIFKKKNNGIAFFDQNYNNKVDDDTSLICSTDDLTDCFQKVDAWIQSVYGWNPDEINRYSNWRLELASEDQKKKLKELGVSIENKPNVTKGQANNAITRIIHGAGESWKMKNDNPDFGFGPTVKRYYI
jgi:ATP-dependent helicase IRC3